MAIGGKITYDNAASYLPEATKNIDINHLVVETDAPFLSPIPFRKQTNTPLLMEYTIKKISEVLNMDLENLEKILFNNSIKLFNI
jgi:TatD DNase family protein